MPYNQVPLHFVISELSATIKGLKTKLRDDLDAYEVPDEGFVDVEEDEGTIRHGIVQKDQL